MSGARMGVATAGAMLLSACNMIVSDEPMLVRGPDTPAMKPGIWMDAAKPDCDFDEASAPETWPECADPAIVHEDGRFFTYDEDNGSWKSIRVLLGSGDPTVVQVELPVELTGGSDDAPKFVYLALRPTEVDPDGLITAISTWVVFCGPVDESEPAKSIEDAVTKAPFEGLTVAESVCTAEDVAAIENAAAMSEGMQDDPGAARWVREADDVELD